MQVVEDAKSTIENFLDDKITVRSDTIKLELEFKISPNKEFGTNFDVYANFSPRGFYKNKTLSMQDKLSILSLYRQFLDDFMHDNADVTNIQNLSLNSEESKNNQSQNPIQYFKNLFSKFKELYDETKHVPQLLKDVRALHVVTYIDGEALVSSTVQLDADIYNVLSDKLQHEYYQKTFALHICNMKYGRYLIQQRIRKFFEEIEPVSKSFGRVLSFLYLFPWAVFELINLSTGNFAQISFDSQNFDLLRISLSTFGYGVEKVLFPDMIIHIFAQFVGIPFLLSKLLPKIFVQIIRKRFLKF